MHKEVKEIIIVGGGAAGLMCAAQLIRMGFRPCILNGHKKSGAKILISGGTRCNVTHTEVFEEDYESQSPKIVRNILRNYPPRQVISFFKEIGVELKEETGGKLFPVTDSAVTVQKAFLDLIQASSAELRNHQIVTSIEKKNNLFEVQGEGFKYVAKKVVLATGGLSYPETGSDGSGYRLAAAFGHSLLETTPALVPLKAESSSREWCSLQGVTQEVCVSLISDGKRVKEFVGSLLFTHLGLSGPVILNISRHWAREKVQNKYLMLNFLPYENKEHFEQELLIEAQKEGKLSVRNFLKQFLPVRLVEVIFSQANVPLECKFSELRKSLRKSLLQSIFESPYKVSATTGYRKAEVTAGGVPLSEVSSKTLESKLCESFYFAGEVLDVDGHLGGFNFQWAWSSAFVVAQDIAKKLKSS